LSVPQIAEQLHVDAVIEGTVLRVNNKVRISIRLTAAKPERQLWAASYERDLSDAITLQNQIATDAVTQIRAQLTPEARTRLNLENRINPEAYDEYLRARFLLRQETVQANKAIPHLQRAIQLDPNFAAAYAALGEAWGMEGVWGRKSNNKEVYATALAYSQKAVSLDPMSSEAYASLGHSLMQSHRWNEGEVALRRAIELDPNNPYAAEYLAVLLGQKGRVDEGLQISRQLAIANPVSADFQRIYAMMLYRDRKYDDAIALCERIIDLDPNHLATYLTLATSLVEKGRYQEAEVAFKKANNFGPGVQAWLYVRKGNPESARKVLNDNSALVDPHSAVALYLLGDQEAGLVELDRLADQWNTKTYNLRNDPLFDPMRSDPRFAAIVKKSGVLDN
jgi:tetratricopeptide (TPR) repeat protein